MGIPVDDSVEALLIAAHEAERTRIAKQLHDDIGQRMAVLTMDLDLLEKALPLQPADALRRIQALSARSLELAKDIQALSHRLYPTKLEYLGLVSACASLCSDVSKQEQVDVGFCDEGVPDDLAAQVALVLFRVLQEAVANAVKHSGASRVDVALVGVADGIRLEIVDGGVGFDTDAVSNRGASGLVGMRARTRLVGGELVVRSRPGGGTSISALVPRSVADRSVTRPG
jgi:signal transduction histidine kinase